MDPLAALQAEVKKRKSEQAAAKESTRRWRSQAEIEQEREQRYYKRQKEADEKRELKRRRENNTSTPPSTATTTTASATAVTNGSTHQAPEKNNQKVDAAPNVVHSRTTSAKGNRSSKNDRDKIPPLPKDEVIRKLRALKQPATFFGETDWMRFKRLRELQNPEDEHQTDGQENKDERNKRETQTNGAVDHAVEFDNATKPKDKHENGPSTDGENGISKQKSQVENRKATVKSKDILKRDEPEGDVDVNDAVCKEDFVHGYIRKYMRLWHSELETMSQEGRRSNKGKSQLATYEQTKDWLKPLEKLLRKRKLSRTILDALRDIFHAAAQREYMTAMRLYLERLAIGNAPWPMGATQVGIHSRAAREKIGEDKIAHVMNDEQTRKYIQAAKRLLTVAQRHFPTDASKSAST